MKSFAEINRYIDDFTISLDSKSSYSLDRIKSLLNHLDNPQEKFRTVHIAGTSGKTSTAYYAAGMLAAAGYKTGLTVSPHMDEINERVQIDLKPLAEKEFAAAFSEFAEMLNKLRIKPTYFELIISFAYWYFAKTGVDYAVVEVGLGGLLDATNVIERQDKVCVITDIGLDHVQILGNDLSEVATQKAGIIQKDNVVFMNRQDKSVLETIKKVARLKEAELNVIDPAGNKPVNDLAGFQLRNWNLAKQACLYVFKRDKNSGLSNNQWHKTTEIFIPGRMELISHKGKTIVLDGAHNSQKIQSFAAGFKTKFPGVRPPVVLAVADTKDIHLATIAAEIKALAGLVIITEFESGQDAPTRSIDPKRIASHFDRPAVVIETDINKAMQLLSAQKEDVLLVTGSLYLVRAARKALKETA